MGSTGCEVGSRCFEPRSWAARFGDRYRCSFKNSSLVCFVFTTTLATTASSACAGRLRMWEYHAVIYDVSVHPELQGQGVGSAMLRELLTKLPVGGSCW